MSAPKVYTDQIMEAAKELCDRIKTAHEVMETLRSALKGMLEDWEDHFGEGACDCRPEPENQGHICNVCKARLALLQ